MLQRLLSTSIRNVVRSIAYVVFALVSVVESQAQLLPSPSVDPFTGTFRCSIPVITIPGPHGGGYTVSLNYSSDIQAEAEASWVGYGWSLEAPSITRSCVGVPDDLVGGTIKQTLNSKICSQAATLQGNMEILSSEKIGAGLSLTAGCNTATGFDAMVSGGPNICFSAVSVGTSIDTKGRFGVGIGFSLVLETHQVDVDLPQGVVGPLAQKTEAYSGAGAGTSLFTYDPTSRNNPAIGLMYPFRGETHVYNTTFKMGNVGGWETGATVSFTTMATPQRDLTVNGYLHSSELGLDAAKSAISQDYLVDGERQLSSGDPSNAQIPMPLPAYDKFIVSGTGSDGTFRAHLPLPLRLRPVSQISTLSLYSLSAKVAVPLGGGIGASLPIPADYTLTVGDHNGDRNDANSDILLVDQGMYGASMRPFFRFNDDPADEVRYATSDGPIGVSMDGPDKGTYYPINRGRYPNINRSIEWLTFADLRQLQSKNIDIKRYFGFVGKNMKKSNCFDAWDTDAEVDNSLIGFFRITSESGVAYEFGAPVQRSYETSRTYTVPAHQVQRAPQRIYYMNDEEINGKVLQASEDRPYRFVYQWNATAILGQNYVDVNDNGPDQADAGAWTKFTYTEPALRYWRIPYNGYLLDRGDVDDKADDKFTFMDGKSEVAYLKTIETATHVAYFYSSSDPNQSASGEVWTKMLRKDDHEPASTSDAEKAPSPRDPSSANSQYLTRIELWSKGPDGTIGNGSLLKTVHFVYDYSLQPGNPSSEAISALPQSTACGKLTLRRIWVDDRRVREQTIEPIDFFYQYPTTGTGGSTVDRDNVKDDSPSILASRYGNALIPTVTDENPSHNANSVDAWGQPTGAQPTSSDVPDAELLRMTSKQKWQSAVANKDDAPWRLKTIRLSSGARIVPVYEQRTYSWVQDNSAAMLIPLRKESGDWSRCTSIPGSANALYVDLATMGVGAQDHEDYIALLKEKYEASREPIYFKFCYRTKESQPCPPDETSDRFYVRGYGRITHVNPQPVVKDGRSCVEFRIGQMNDVPWTSSSFSSMDNAHATSPYRLAIRHWKTFLKGKGACPDHCSEQDAWTMLTLFGRTLESIPFVINSLFPISEELLPRIDPERCLVRLPMWQPKRGCGVRTKRLLTISPSGTLEDGDLSAVGTEYIYEGIDATGKTVSWGVATCEPTSLREENPLTRIAQRYWSRAADHIIDENEMAWAEERIPDALLPSPSVGYERVITKSINTQANTPGFAVAEFTTSRTQPLVRRRQVTTRHHVNEFDPVNVAMYNRSTLDLELHQEAYYELYNSHGLPVSVQSYTGNYAEPATHHLVRSTQYIWKSPGEPVYAFDTLDRPLRRVRRGDAMDVVFESRKIRESQDLTRLDLSWASPLIFGISGMYSGIEHEIRSYASTVLHRRSPHLLKTITYDRGLLDTSEIVAVHALSGFPAIVSGADAYRGSLSPRSNPNGAHDGRVASMSIPAFKTYSELGRKTLQVAARFGASINTPSIGTVSITYPSANHYRLSPTTTLDLAERRENLLMSVAVGDEYQVYKGNELKHVIRVTDVANGGSNAELAFDLLSPGPTIIEESPDSLRLIRSGKRNRLTESAETIVVYGWDPTAAQGTANTLYDLEQTLEMFMDWGRVGSILGNTRHINPFGYYTPQGSFEPPVGPPVGADIDPFHRRADLSGGVCPTDLSKYWVAVDAINPYNETGPKTFTLGLVNPSAHANPANPVYQSDCGATYDPVWQTCGYPIYRTDFLTPCPVPEIWVNVSTSGRSRDTYTWDAWRRFRVGDRGTVTVGTQGPKLSDANKSPNGLYFRATGYTGLSLTSIRTVDVDAPTLAYTLVPYKAWDVEVPNTSRVARQWQPVTAWTYESALTIDASHVAGQGTRAVQDLAGTFELPVPFASWSDPATSQAILPVSFPVDAWTRGAMVAGVDMNGSVVKAVDNAGRISVVQRDPSGRLVQAAFDVAGISTLSSMPWYNDCESGLATVAHSGSRSIAVQANGSVSIDKPAHVGTISASGDVLIRLWLRPQSATTDKVVGTVSVAGSTLTEGDSLACSDGWRLINVTRSAVACTSSVAISCVGGPAVYVDDVVVQDPMSSSTCMTYDKEYRPTTALDEDHFATLWHYDQRGAVVSIEQETVTGRVAQAHTFANGPRRQRMDGALHGGAYTALNPTPFSVNGWENDLNDILRDVQDAVPPINLPSGIGAKERLLDANISPDGIRSSTLIDGLLKPKPSSDSTGGRPKP
ncbi:MAG: hypothetical protein IAE64_02720 [Flavobacteriales bacterium]|nr:hypothetical protein [Flavobacteriales bacterium]MCL4277069.1 hypothetical protein [Ignavibacteria bacterium]